MLAVARRYACGAPTSLGPAWELSARRLCGEHKTAASDARILWGHGSSGPRPQDQGRSAAWWGNHLGEVRWQLDAARLLVHPVLRGRGVSRAAVARSSSCPVSSPATTRSLRWRSGYAGSATGRPERVPDRHGLLAGDAGAPGSAPGLWRMKPAGASDSSATAVAPTRAGPGGAPPRSGLPRDRARGRPQPADGRQRADRSGGGAEALQRRSLRSRAAGLSCGGLPLLVHPGLFRPVPGGGPADQHLLEGRWGRPLAVLRGPIRVQRRGQRDPRRPGTQPPGLRRDRDRPAAPAC